MMRIVSLLLIAAAASPVWSAPAVRFAVVADQTGSAMPGVYDSVLAEVARLDPDFVVTVGDQVEGYLGSDTVALGAEYDLLAAQFDRAFGRRAREETFLIRTPGNHDITTDAAEPVWRSRVGPPYRRVDAAGVTVLVLDNSRAGEADPIAPDQVRFLERELSGVRPEDPVLVLMHKPYFSQTVWEGRDDPLHPILVKKGVDAVLAGHWHDYVYEPRDGVLYVVCGSSGGAVDSRDLANGKFVGFLWGTIREGKVSITPISLGSVHPADLFNAAENRILYRLTASGIEVTPYSFEEGAASIRVSLPEDMVVAGADSIRWKVPENWSVAPLSAPFAAATGARSASFEVRCSAIPFPLPSLSTTVRFGREKSCAIELPLRIQRTARCGGAKGIRVDGAISPGEWEETGAETIFMSPEAGPSGADPAEFLFASDARGIYFAARCVIGRDHPCVAEMNGRDEPIHREDCVGWFLASADSVIHQIYVNPNGAVFDGRGTMRGGTMNMDYGWNGEYEVGASRGEDQYSVEIFVPFKNLDVGERVKELKVNFRRKQPALKTTSDWMPVSFDPKLLGRLVLGG